MSGAVLLAKLIALEEGSIEELTTVVNQYLSYLVVEILIYPEYKNPLLISIEPVLY